MAGDTSIDMMINVLPGTLTGIFALNAGLSSINQQFQNMTKAVDNHFGIVDAAIVSATALATQFGLKAADAFGQYEQGMKIVQAVSNQSAASIAELGQKASEFSVQYRMDIDELTTGLQTLGRAGLKSAQEQAEVLENGLQTAKLEGRDLNSVLEELIQNTALLGGDLKSADFGEQTKYVNDLSVATSMTAPITTHDVSETLKYSGGIAAAAGANIETEEGKKLLEDYMASIAAFAQKGVKGSIAGTALRAFFNKPATQDSSVLEGLGMIGLKPEYLWEDDQQTMKPVSEQISLIQNQMDKKGISQMDRLQIWSKIVGGKMGQQMMKLDGGEIKEITKDIQEANSAENLATQSMQTYQSALKQTGEAGQQAFRAFGEHVARFLTPIAKMLTPILQAMANPVISTTVFTGFIALIGNAWKSVQKIFSSLRLEIGMVKSLMSSTILNQDARKGIVGNRPWGAGGFTDERVAVEQIAAKVKETNVSSNASSSEVVAKLEDIRRIVAAVNNRIKEVLLEIQGQLSTGISTYSQKINQAITSTGGKIKTEFGSSLTQAANSFGTKMSQVVSSSATKMKTEFQLAMNALTYTPKVGATGMGRSGAAIAQKTDLSSGSYFFSRQLGAKVNEAETAFQSRFSDLEKNRSNVILSQQVKSNRDKAEKTKNTLNAEALSLKEQLKKISSDIQTQEGIISSANKQLRENYNSLSTQQKADIAVQKTQAEVKKETLIEQQILLTEELEYKKKEIGIHRSIIASLSAVLREINAERIANIKGKTTVVGAPGIMPIGYTGQIPAEYSPIITNPNYSVRSGYGFGSYGYYGSQKSMPGVAGMFHWGMVPSEYHPNYSTTGRTYTPWNFKVGSGKGASLLANLRSQEIAMTKEMQQALGISNKELIRFYEELLQVNMALAETKTINQGKSKTYSPTTMEQAYQKQLENDTLYKTKGNMVPIYPSSGTGHITEKQMRGLRALFGENNGPSASEFEKDYSKTVFGQKAINSQYNRYNLPDTTKQLEEYEKQQKLNKVQSASYPASAMMLYNNMEENNKRQADIIKKSNENLIKRQGFSSRAKYRLNNFFKLSGASNIAKGFKGLGSALSSATSIMGGPFFAAIMAVDVAMQIWNHYQQEYSKKLQEATQKLDDMIQKQSEAEEIFYGGKHEKGEREIQGWDDENPDADYETREQALLDAYESIYDNRSKGLSALDENTQQLAIATQEVKLATEKIGQVYLDEKDFFSGIGPWSDFWHESAKGANAVQDAAMIDTDPTGFWKTANDKETSDNKNYVVDKHGNIMSAVSGAKNYFQGQDVVLDTSWQTGEDYPWLKEFSPIISADIWRERNTKSGLEIALGGAGFEKLQDQLSSVGGWDNSAWTKHGYNIMDSFGTETEQNKLQMGLKNYQKDFSKLAKQMRRFEKSTGKTPLKALNQQFGKTKDMKKALKNLSVQDPKLVSYIKSLAIKTGMDAQQVLMAAQLQQLQEMQSIARDQVTPRMESLVQGSYEYLGYGRNIMGEVNGSGDGAISAAQNARAIAILLNAQMEDELNKRNFEDYQSHYEDPSKLKYQTPEQLAAAEQWAHNHPTEQNKWLRDLYDTKMGTYASVNAQLYNPQMSVEDAAKRGQAFVDAYNNSDVSAAGILDTLRKGGIGGLSKNILDAYDAGLDEQDSGGSGGSGSGKGSDKNKDNTGTKKERVDLVLCNKKEIPKLNVNLFKKAPSFTILNKNFKLRDIKVNTQDKPKAVLASIKNAIIDVQKRTDPKIIQDEEAIYDPVGATDGNTPSGTSDVRTNTG